MQIPAIATVPLSQCDRLFLALDRELRVDGMRGNFVEAVFELDGLPDPALLEKRIAAFVQRFPIMRARLRKTWRGHEWVETGHTRPCFHFHPYSPSSSPMFDYDCPWNSILKTHRSADDINPIEFHLVELEKGSLLINHGYHAVIDGKGYEHFLHTLFNDAEWESAQQTESRSKPLPIAIASELSLAAKTSALVKAIRYFLRGAKSSLPPVKTGARTGMLASKRIRYTPDETKAMMQAARSSTAGAPDDAGPRSKTGQFAYFVASTMRALHQSGVGKPGEGFNIGYMATLRPGRERHPILGNQVSFLWMGAEYELVRDRRKLIAALAAQHANAVEQGMDRTVVAALDWGRFIPLSTLGQLIRRGLGRAERHSFWFGYTGPFSSDLSAIEGVPILGNFAIVPPTAPPSICFTYTIFQGCMTVSVSYIPDQLAPKWVDDVVQRLDVELRKGDVMEADPS